MDRLSAQDMSSIWPEMFGWPFDIGGLAILDGDNLVDASGDVRLDYVREAVESKLHFVPRFRQLLHQPGFGFGRPLWVDAPSFDITDHIHVMPLGPASDEGQLLRACEQLHGRRLDPSRPLWEMWLLPGLTDGRVGLFLKMHHAIADGVTGVATFASLLDMGPDPARTPTVPWIPGPMPSKTELFQDNLSRHTAQLATTFSKLAHLPDVWRRIRRAWPALSEFFFDGPAARTSVNRPIGSRRRFDVVRTSLDLAKEAAHSAGAKVNDVLLTAIAGGLRDLLRSRGEPVDGLVLRAVVPVSLHTQLGSDAANLDGAMVVPLPIGISDPAQRLCSIASETAKRKKKPRPAGGTVFRYGFLQRAFLRLYPRQRFVNVYVANVPGPPIPLYFAGANLTEVYPLIPILGNLTLGVGALSYAGQFNITVVSDADLCPDVDVFTAGIERTFDQLSSNAETHTLDGSEQPLRQSRQREVVS